VPVHVPGLLLLALGSVFKSTAASGAHVGFGTI
jgi:hypothetical protein